MNRVAIAMVTPSDLLDGVLWASVTAVVVATLTMAVISARSMAARSTTRIGEIQSNGRQSGDSEGESEQLPHKGLLGIGATKCNRADAIQTFPIGR